jgi:hypothetical protein
MILSSSTLQLRLFAVGHGSPSYFFFFCNLKPFLLKVSPNGLSLPLPAEFA